LRRELEQLLQETKTLLADADFAPSAWEAYEAQRTTIFVRLQGLPLPTDEEESAAVSALIQEILAHDAILIQKAQARLVSLRAELTALAVSRRALQSYTVLSSPILLQRDV
jgi:hypothetical protein